MVNTKFVDDLSTASPTPGGGGAAAYAGALAAALGSMVGNITVTKKAFADRADELNGNIAMLDSCRTALIELIDADESAFAALAATWKLPRGTASLDAARHDATQNALTAACEVPLQIMRVCAKVIEIDEYLAQNSSHMAIADVGSSVVLARAAMQAAVLNVYSNTCLMDDAAAAKAYETEARDMLRNFIDTADMTYDYVVHDITNAPKSKK